MSLKGIREGRVNSIRRGVLSRVAIVTDDIGQAWNEGGGTGLAMPIHGVIA